MFSHQMAAPFLKARVVCISTYDRTLAVQIPALNYQGPVIIVYTTK